MTPNAKSQSPPAPGILGSGPPPVWQILGSRILGLWRSGRGLWTTSPRPPPLHLIWSCIWEREKQVTKEGPRGSDIYTRKCPCVKITFPIQNYTSCLQQHWETWFHHTLALDWWTSYLRVGVSANGVGLLFFPWSPPGIFVFVLEGKRLRSWSLRTKKEPTMQVMPVLQLTSHGLHSAVLGMSKILLLKCQADIWDK